MKSKIKIYIFLSACYFAIGLLTTKAIAQESSVSFQVFYDELSPYGTWVNDPEYGYVWIPEEGADFSPYSSNGHWVYTEAGWTWYSDYSWGWAPFHYGRWFNRPEYGYVWVPDTEWGPAWVTWRRSEGYYGWAPMQPGVSINIAFGNSYNVPNNHWTFVHDRDLYRHDIHNYYVNQTNNVTIIKNSTVINNVYKDEHRHETYITGPERKDVQKASRQEIKIASIRENAKPGQQLTKGELSLYRPRIENNIEGKRAVPAKVIEKKEIKAVSGRIATEEQKKTKQSPHNSQAEQIKKPKSETSVIHAPKQQQTPSQNSPLNKQAPASRNAALKQAPTKAHNPAFKEQTPVSLNPAFKEQTPPSHSVPTKQKSFPPRNPRERPQNEPKTVPVSVPHQQMDKKQVNPRQNLVKPIDQRRPNEPKRDNKSMIKRKTKLTGNK